jgi:16S rRNA (uracil1498-N3)-methyltransferase
LKKLSLKHRPRIIAEGLVPKLSESSDILSSHAFQNKAIALRTEQLHHLKQVLRLSPGSTIEVFFKDIEMLFLGQISQSWEVLLTEQLPLAKIPRFSLLVGLTKPKTLETIVEQCTELGAREIIIFEAEHSTSKLGKKLQNEDKGRILPRLEKIRDSACAQAQLPHYCKISLCEDLTTAIQNLPPSSIKIALFGPSEQNALILDHKKEKVVNLVSLLSQNQKKATNDIGSFSRLQKQTEDDDIYLIIGPEAGFSKSERGLFANGEFVLSTLGETVLRTETASIVASALAMTIKTDQ